ncbi:MAG: hypothetical protein AB7F43_15110 [Bacteriovoracia bacterium]
MNLEELKKVLPGIAESAQNLFGSKSDHMTFLPKDNGCASFMKAGDWFQWYWYDFSNQTWRETHMLLNENWLYQEETS